MVVKLYVCVYCKDNDHAGISVVKEGFCFFFRKMGLICELLKVSLFAFCGPTKYLIRKVTCVTGYLNWTMLRH